MTKEIVIDLASYQSGMSVAQIRNTGAKVAIIKLTESTNYTNPYAYQEIQRCKQAGIKHIHFYHFQRGTSVLQLRAEAQYCVNVARQFGYKGSYIFLDAELTGAVPSTEAIKEFYKVVRQAGYKAGFYTYKFMYPYFAKSVFTGSDGVWAAAYPLGSKPAYELPDMNYFPSVDNCLAWQFTDNWKGMKVDGSITLDDRLTSGNLPPLSKDPEYYTAKLKRVRLKRPTYIYKDKKLKTKVQQFDTGEEFEIVDGPFKDGKKTRYKTESGFYITGNLDYVSSIYHLRKEWKGSKTVELKKAAKLYKDKEFKKVVREYPKGTQFNIKDNVGLPSGRRCFKTESGFYITANKDYVKFV